MSSLVAALEEVADRHADRVALVQREDSVTYRGLWDTARAVGATLVERAPSVSEAAFVGVMGGRSLRCYENLLAVALAGRGYLPLEVELPPRRLAGLIERAGVRWLVTPAAELPLVAEVCAAVGHPLTVLVPDGDAHDAASVPAPHVVLTAADLSAPAPGGDGVASDDDPLYLLYTSGSTGVPKGVVVEHRNVSAMLAAMRTRVDLGPDDVVGQLFKLSFDPSVLMVFLAWSAGAAVAVPGADDGVLDEARLIERHGVTVWGAVPSRSTIMRRLRQLKPGAYPGLRYVFHGGEALTTDLCDAWTAAAPAARIINQYGPTEATVCVTDYAWDAETSPAECEGSRVPIGEPLPGVRAVVVDADLAEVAPGTTGELLVGGDQLARGYLGDPERTEAAFVTLPALGGRFYRTGDLVRRAGGGPLLFAGRADDQVKVLGRRIELGEVEAAVRDVLEVPEAAAIGWPATGGGGFDGIEVFVVGAAPQDARERLAARLPPEAVPRRIHDLSEMPMSGNGKIDRAALRARLGA